MNQQTFLLRKSIFATPTRRQSSAALSGSDDTGVDELLNFLSDLVIAVVSMNAKVRMVTIAITYHRVLHMVVERPRILLGVCKDFYEIIRSRFIAKSIRLTPHDGIVHDLRDLGIPHSPRVSLFLSLATPLLLNLVHNLHHVSLQLPSVFLLHIRLGGLLQSFQSSSVLLHTLLHESLPDISLDESRIDGNGCLGVLEGFGQSEELGVTSGSVIVRSRVGGKSFDGLRVVLLRTGEVSLLERLVTLLPRLLSLLGVNISLPVGLGLGLLRFSQLGEDIRGTVLSERLLEEFDGLCKVAQLGIGATDTSVGLGKDLVVGTEITAFLNGLFTGLDTFLVLALLEVDGFEVYQSRSVIIVKITHQTSW